MVEIGYALSSEEHGPHGRPYVDAGFDRVSITQIGPNQAEFFDFFAKELAPALADIGVRPASADE